MDIYIEIMVLALGLIMGSFVNCLVWRLHQDESLLGRSYCPSCRKMIAWYDNIPLLSFIFLGGRCRHCRRPISWQYPLVEMATALLFWLLLKRHWDNPQIFIVLLRDWLVALAAVAIFVYDSRWQLVPMMLVWPIGGLTLILGFALGIPWWQVMAGGLAGAAFFAVIYGATRGRGLGTGDIWLGLWLGFLFPAWPLFFAWLTISFLIGGLVGAALLILGRKSWKSRVALGPFLVLGALIVLIWGPQITGWFFNLP